MPPISAFSTDADMKINLCLSVKSIFANCLQLSAVLLMLVFLSPVSAIDNQPYPEFTAVYEARINGFLVAEARFSLRKLDDGDYLYQRKLSSVGVASLFGKKVSIATSRWRFVNNWIQVQEYQTSNEDGDADDNLHLMFNWKTAQVKNVASADPWQTKMPTGTLDKLAMQLALLFELRDGGTEFQYPVAHEGRIKQYRFKQIGKETIKLPMGEYNTLVVERLDDDRDNTRIWSAPELNYFPVRFLERKKSGVKKELSLRMIEFIAEEAAD